VSMGMEGRSDSRLAPTMAPEKGNGTPGNGDGTSRAFRKSMTS
jgi:hypothetical protein